MCRNFFQYILIIWLELSDRLSVMYNSHLVICVNSCNSLMSVVWQNVDRTNFFYNFTHLWLIWSNSYQRERLLCIVETVEFRNFVDSIGSLGFDFTIRVSIVYRFYKLIIFQNTSNSICINFICAFRDSNDLFFKHD